MKRAVQGIVPPPGPLPRRFGPPWYSLWFSRLVTLAALGYGLIRWIQSLMETTDSPLALLGLLAALALGVLAALRWWQRRQRELTALAVTFEYGGISVQASLGSRRLAWGDLAGLEPRTDRVGGWSLRADEEGQELRVRLPAKAGWARELVALLRGAPGGAAPVEAREPESTVSAEEDGRQGGDDEIE